MVLDADYKSICGNLKWIISYSFLSILRINTIINKSLFKCFCQMTYSMIITIVTFLFSSGQGMDGVVKVICPLGLKPISACFIVADELYIIHVAFGDQKIFFSIFLFDLIYL